MKKRLSPYYQPYFLCLLLISPAVFSEIQEQSVPFFTVEYDAKIKGYSVDASRQYKALDNGDYALTFSAESMLANFQETSEFSWKDGHIEPKRYNFQQHVLGRNSERALLFDTANQRITSTNSGKIKHIELGALEKVLDGLNYQLQLQYDLQQNTDEFNYVVADKGKLRKRSFHLVKEEKIKTKLGLLDTIKVELEHPSDKRVTYIWFAKDWHHLLVRFEQYEQGKKDFEIKLSDAVINGQQISGL